MPPSRSAASTETLPTLLGRLRYAAMSVQWSLSGKKQTWGGLLISVAIDPKRTSGNPPLMPRFWRKANGGFAAILCIDERPIIPLLCDVGSNHPS